MNPMPPGTCQEHGQPVTDTDNLCEWVAPNVHREYVASP